MLLNILESVTSFKAVDILIFLALILGMSKLLGLGAKKLGLPQVVALLLTGLILVPLSLISFIMLFSPNSREEKYITCFVISYPVSISISVILDMFK